MENLTLTTSSSSDEGYSRLAILLRMYYEPVLCVVSLIGSIAVLFGMTRVKNHFSSSVRYYYSVIAIAELTVVAGYYIVGDFLEIGIAYLVSDGAFYPILTYDATNWSCKLLNVLWMGPDFCVGFTYICLGVERVIAVTWPFRAKTILTLRNSILFESTVNLLILGSFLPLLCIDYTIDPQYGCWYDFSLPFTVFYIFLEETIPLVSSFTSLSISLYLVVKFVQLTLARSHISTGGSISARELSNIATLMVFDMANLIVYVPDGVIYFIYAIVVANPSAFSDDFNFTIYQLADVCDRFTLIPHALTFFIHFSRSRSFRRAFGLK